MVVGLDMQKGDAARRVCLCDRSSQRFLLGMSHVCARSMRVSCCEGWVEVKVEMGSYAIMRLPGSARERRAGR